MPDVTLACIRHKQGTQEELSLTAESRPSKFPSHDSPRLSIHQAGQHGGPPANGFLFR